MSPADNEILAKAANLNTGLVLSIPCEGRTLHFKTRFIRLADDALVIEAPSNEQPLFERTIASKSPIGISFKAGVSKVVCATTLLSFEPHFEINVLASVAALRLAIPPSLNLIKWRSSYRVPVTAGSALNVRVWTMTADEVLEQRAIEKFELNAVARDLSMGGMAVEISGPSGKPPALSNDDRIRIQLTYADSRVTLEGRLRLPTLTLDKKLRAGVQFKPIDSTLQGRQVLTTLSKILAELHREENQRSGLPAVA